jgi:hypothetical protein
MFGLGLNTQLPARHAAAQRGACDSEFATLTHGLMAGTRVASNLGWRAIDALAVGDKVLTFDHGMQQIVRICRARMWRDAPGTAAALWPVVIPQGALGNREELVLLPDQGVMIESDAAHDLHGDPFMILTAHSLVGLRGIHRRQPVQRVELTAIYFDHDEVMYAEGGALVHCPADMFTLDKFLEAVPPTYTVLSGGQAEELVSLIALEDETVIQEQQMPPCLAL